MPRPASASQRGFGASVGGRAAFSPRSAQDHSSVNLQRTERSSHQLLYQQHIVPLLSIGRLTDAEPILNLLRQSQTGVAEVYRDLAVLAEARDDQVLAAQHRDQWLENPSVHLVELETQAAWAEHLGRRDQAYRLRLALLERDPSHCEASLQVARHLMLDEAFAEALPLLQRVGPLCDDIPQALALHAVCCVELGDAMEGAHLARQSLADGESGLAHAALAAALHQQADEQAALIHLQRALELGPPTRDFPWPIPRLLARICLEHHRISCAEQLLQKACDQQPLSHQLRHQMGELLLLQGQLTRGFRYWAGLSDHQPDQQSHHPALVSVPLVLVANGPLGDTLLFSRYAPWIAKVLNRPVHFYVQPPVVTLLHHSLPAEVEVKPLSEYKQHLACHSLDLLTAPALFGACDFNVELQKPCLQADPALVACWRDRLALAPGERLIGINWHGSAAQALRERISSNIPLEALAPLASLPGVRLVSLQKGFGAEQLRFCSFRHSFVTCQDAVTRETRIEQMAALIALCDWVVCDDSGPAHLAGSLGRPTCLLLSTRSSWRWGLEECHSLWYPSIQLLRCSGGLDWAGLAQQAAQVISLEL